MIEFQERMPVLDTTKLEAQGSLDYVVITDEGATEQGGFLKVERAERGGEHGRLVAHGPELPAHQCTQMSPTDHG